MKKSLLLMLSVCSSVYAESRVLPPVVDNSIYPQGGGYASAAPTTSAMYEVLGRLEQLQAEVQQLRGVVEEQSQIIDDLKNRQGNIYSDLDLRIQELSGVKQAVAGEVSGQSASSLPPSDSSLVEQTDQAGSDATASNQPAVNNVQPVETEKTRYQAAYELLRNGHNSRAIAEFKDIIATYPQGEFADNAQYWLGEAYKVNQNLDAAKQAFLQVVMNYVDSPKVPDALLKLGYIEFEQKNIAQAKDYLTQITVAFPDTTAAHLAKKKLLQIGAQQL